MTAILLFIVLPVALIVLSFFIKPMDRDQRLGDQMGEGLVARGLFGDHGLQPDEVVIREDTEPVRFRLD